MPQRPKDGADIEAYASETPMTASPIPPSPTARPRSGVAALDLLCFAKPIELTTLHDLVQWFCEP